MGVFNRKSAVLLSCGALAFSASNGAYAQSVYSSYSLVDIETTSIFEEKPDEETAADAIRAALKHNPQIDIASAQRRVAKSEQLRALGQFLPSIEGSAVYASDDFRSASLATLEDRDGLTMGVTFRQPVFRGFSSINTFREKNARVKASTYLVDDSQNRVALLAGRAHASVILAREIVEHRRENLTLVSRQLEVTEARMKAGAQSRTGVEQARMRVARAQVALQEAIATRSANEASYEAIVGHKPLKLSPRKGRLSIDEFQTLESATAAALAANPALNAARETVSASKHAKSAARGAFSPDLSIEGSFFRRYAEDPAAPDEDEYQIVARMRIPIFAQGANHAGLKRAASEAAQDRAQLAATRLAVNETMTRAWRERTAAAARRDAARDAISAAELSVEGLQIEFEAGRRTVIDVLDGQRDLVEAKISLSRANFDLRLAEYELASTMGAYTAMAADETAAAHQLDDETLATVAAE